MADGRGGTTNFDWDGVQADEEGIAVGEFIYHL